MTFRSDSRCNSVEIAKGPQGPLAIGESAPHDSAPYARFHAAGNSCVDEVSQWQVQACVQGIIEAFLLPLLALIIAQFPFEIAGFHSDNGSEYINRQVAQMLNKLNIEQTKSRARHSNDNALAQSKNASVVRKHMGYSPIVTG